MHTDSGMTGISPSGFMPYMTVASLEMSDEPYIIQPRQVNSTRPIRIVLQFSKKTRKNTPILCPSLSYRRPDSGDAASLHHFSYLQFGHS